MAKYSTKRTVHEQDVIGLTQQEYDIFNRIYKEALKTKMSGNSNDNDKTVIKSIVDAVELRYVILTDGTYRVEFVVDKT